MTGFIDNERIERVRTALQFSGLAGLVCVLPENVLLLSGYWPRIALSLVWFPAEGDPALLVPDSEIEAAEQGFVQHVRVHTGELHTGNPIAAMADFLRDQIGAQPGPIGYEAGFWQVAPPPLAGESRVVNRIITDMLASVVGADRLHDATDLIYALRALKTPHEVEGLRKANRVAAVGIARFHELVTEGRSEIEIAAEVERAIAVAGVLEHDAQNVRAWAQISSGPGSENAWRFFARPGARRLQAGDLALLELGTVVDGFWSDLTRPAVVGQPTDQQREIWQIVAEAQAAAIAAICPNAKAHDVDAAARDLITARGYGERFVHITGHGLGFRYHEPAPILAAGSADVLQPGMVTSVEPGIYIPGWGGIRIEQNVLVTDTGAEILSTAPIAL